MTEIKATKEAKLPYLVMPEGRDIWYVSDGKKRRSKREASRAKATRFLIDYCPSSGFLEPMAA
jgi:hypothetical protein